MTTTPTKPRRGRTAVPNVDATTSSTSAIDALAAAPALAGVATTLPLATLHPHPHNPRRDLGDLTELADSIRAHGVRQNLLVVPEPAGEWRIVIGHRRAAAAALAGLEYLPVVVDEDLDEAGQLELMLLENLQRADLTPVEEADGYQGLLDLGVDVKAIATRTGRAESTVRARLRLAALPEKARVAVHEHRATLEDAAALAEFDDDPATQNALASLLGTRSFTVELTNARQRAERRRRVAPVLARLLEVGATQLPSNEWETPDGSTLAAQVWLHSPDVDMPLARLAEATAAWSWRQYYSELKIYRPMTPEELEAAAAEPEWKARQRERDEEFAQRKAAWEEHAATTNETRADFVRSLLAHKQLTKAQSDALVQYVGFELLTAAAWDDTAALYPDTRDLPRWLGVDVEAVTERATDEEHEADEVIDDEIRAAIAALPAVHRLLVAAAGGAEPITWHVWEERGRALRAYYALLEQLGYPVSDAERTALEPAPAEGGEPS
jgi:ParB family chromosome partitioning protein